MEEAVIVFVTGTDTGVGKTVVTGLLARGLLEGRTSVITQKPVQTGSSYPEDIAVHRRIMGVGLEGPELLKYTCPYVFEYPAAPETAASLEGKSVDLEHLIRCTLKLSEKYEVVLVEGAGGLLVPLTESHTFLDLIKALGCNAVVVSAAKLGTINHTLLTLEVLRSAGVEVTGLVYNLYFSTDSLVAETSLKNIKRFSGIKNVLTVGSLEETRLSADEVKRFLCLGS